MGRPEEREGLESAARQLRSLRTLPLVVVVDVLRRRAFLGVVHRALLSRRRRHEARVVLGERALARRLVVVVRPSCERSTLVDAVLVRLARRDRDEDARDDGREPGDPPDDQVGDDGRLLAVPEVLARRLDERVDDRLRDPRGRDDTALGRRDDGRGDEGAKEEERDRAEEGLLDPDRLERLGLARVEDSVQEEDVAEDGRETLQTESDVREASAHGAQASEESVVGRGRRTAAAVTVPPTANASVRSRLAPGSTFAALSFFS